MNSHCYTTCLCINTSNIHVFRYDVSFVSLVGYCDVSYRSWFEFCIFGTFHICLICQYSRVTRGSSTVFLFYIVCFQVCLLFGITWFCLILQLFYFYFLYATICTGFIFINSFELEEKPTWLENTNKNTITNSILYSCSCLQ